MLDADFVGFKSLNELLLFWNCPELIGQECEEEHNARHGGKGHEAIHVYALMIYLAESNKTT